MAGNPLLTAIIVTSSVALFVYHDIPAIFSVNTAAAGDEAGAGSVGANEVLKFGVFLPEMLQNK